ncbi:MAG: universal stress protein [Deltaproteobacteria bacterium]|nr:universal stress protein [Deltaproteobacteria bacterium]
MVEFKKILFPVDLSSISPLLVDHALTMAHKFFSELHVLHVVRAFEPYQGDYVPSAKDMALQAELMDSMRSSLQDFIDKHLSDYPALKSALTSGHTAREILQYIDDNGISLVVMGTHGRRGLDRVFFGSVAQRVVQTSPVPVMTVNPFREATETRNDF